VGEVGGRSALLTAEPSLPLGLGASGPWAEQRAEHRLTLGPGEAVLLFSDGLVESRRRPLLDGLVDLEKVADRLAAEGGQPSTICDGLLGALVGDAPDDDVTVLLLRRDGAGAADRVGARAETLLAAAPLSVPAARRFVDEALRRWDAEPVRDIALLCTSELVTNAVLHARTEVRLSVRITGSTVRVRVSDNGAASVPQRVRSADAHATRGRGLVLVEALSDRWGVDEDERGKTVWFELDVAASGDAES
jgi:anti-sigma regulatory factor (Ser/Thr protein kinase)